MVTTVRKLQKHSTIRFLLLAVFIGPSIGLLFGSTAQAQTARTHGRSYENSRATWTPTRNSQQKDSDADAEFQPAPQTKAVKNHRVMRPTERRKVSAAKAQTTRGRTVQPTNQAVRQAGHVAQAPVYEGEVIYEGGTIVDAGCDALGSCGCDAVGCDAIGSCGPSCGCSMCGEVPSGRAWRPALTLSLPQDGWVSVEALHYWVDGMDLPPLLTTSPNGTAQADAGVLTRLGTTTVFGGDAIFDDDAFDGGRLRFGIWLDRCHTWGIGGEYFDLDRETLRFSQSSTGDPILARPFFNTLTGREDSELVAFPGVVSGTATIGAYSELVGGSFYIRGLRCCSEGCREWLFCGCKGHFCTRSEFRLGYRYLELEEGVSIEEELTSQSTANPGSFDIRDQFDTRNQFNGLDFGWNHRLVRGYWSLDSLVRIAIGNNKQTVTIDGATTITDGTGTTETFDAGVFAVASNSGTFEQDEFSVVPEFGLTLGYQFNDHWKGTVGYSGIYWSNVVRPGQHIPTMLNPEQFPPVVTNPTGDPRPLFAFDTTDYWAHGVTYGLEYRW